MTKPLHIVVAGGGFAAAELLLALRALGEERVDLEIVSPARRLPLRPTATADPSGGVVDTYDLAGLAADTGATFRVDAVEAVAPAAHRARLASGGVAAYDALVLAVGARPRVAVPGALTYRDHRDAPQLRGLLDRRPQRVALAVPSGVTRSLPLYEMALAIAEEDWGPDVSVVTPERSPLEGFGRAISARVGELLVERNVRFIGDTAARSASRDGLELAYGGVLAAEAVIAVPRLAGRRIGGIPRDWNGFVQTDAGGRIEGLDDVFAAGDMTSFPVKHGGLATQQADRIATLLARRAGADVPDARERPVLRTRLFGGSEPIYLEAELDDDGRPVAGAVSGEAPWWPGAKVFGRHLTPWMATHDAVPTAA